MKFTLLGSGAVRPDLDRWGPCQAVEVGDDVLVFDCGRGATMRLVQAGFDIAALRRMFFTHHHYDHNCDFAYLFLTSWVLGRDHPMEVVGPRGTEAFCDALLGAAYGDDIKSRRHHPTYTEQGRRWRARDVLEDHAVIEGDGWRMDMVHVIHKPQVLDNLAFRITSGGKRLVVVGDTMVCDSLCNLAEGCDLLVHECTFPTERIERAEWGQFHASPRAVGRWARERGVRRLMLKHFAVQEGVTVEAMVDEVRSEFGSEGLIVGEDLMTIDV